MPGSCRGTCDRLEGSKADKVPGDPHQLLRMSLVVVVVVGAQSCCWGPLCLLVGGQMLGLRLLSLPCPPDMP